MTRENPLRLFLALFVAAVPLGACAEMDDGEVGEDAILELDVGGDQAAILEEMAAHDPAPACPNEPYLFQGDVTVDPAHQADGNPAEVSAPKGGARPAVYGDRYFHPNSGAHGGWIEAWRLCHLGNNQYVICTGGYAPVRYWKPSVCGGSVQTYYPQGWHGWAPTAGGC